MLFVFKLDKRTPHGDWASSPFSYPELLAYLMFVTILCYVLLFTVISLYLPTLLMNSYFNYCFHECYCTMRYMYLQVIQINIIIIIIIQKCCDSSHSSTINFNISVKIHFTFFANEVM